MTVYLLMNKKTGGVLSVCGSIKAAEEIQKLIIPTTVINQFFVVAHTSDLVQPADGDNE